MIRRTAVVIGGIVLLAVWLSREAALARPTSDSDGETAFDVLKRRYASGEITQEQFKRMRQELG